MAGVKAIALRDRARKAMLSAGGRGFMRFAQSGGALLATDALRRCAHAEEATRIKEALEAEGFFCCECAGLLLLTPTDELLLAGGNLLQRQEPLWDGEADEAMALALRWLEKEPQLLTDAGRQMILETLRLTWQPEDKVFSGLNALRAQAAVQMRAGDYSGLHEAGSVFLDWCMEEKT